MKFLYSLFPKMRVRKHFTLQLDDHLLVYAYIRKNACSAFKKLFVGESPYAAQYPEYEPLGLMGRFHKTRAGDLLNERLLSVVVLRDPYQRLISLYLNKFVVRSGNGDIFANYSRLTGLDPEKATFYEFLTEYVDRFSFKKLDCHLIPQIDHLGRFAYNAPVRFESLFDDLKRVLGEHYAERYFRKKVNATAYADDDVAASYDCMTAPAVLIEQYKRTGAVPSYRYFMCEALEQTINTRYGADVAIVERLNTDYSKCPEGEVPILDAHLPLKKHIKLFA